MKATSEDFKPRRDGWFEHKGTWEEVVVGTVIATQKRTERWEIIDQQMGPAPGPGFGRTLWMRAREQTTGAEFTVEPRMKTNPVTILTQDPRDTRTGERTEPSDAEAVMLLVEELGAEIMATRDNVTGEITCPDYDGTFNHHLEPGPYQHEKAYLEHLRFAHGVDTSALEAIHWEDRIREKTTLHGRLHAHKEPSPGGFPHRHVPEDLTLFTGKR